MTYTKGLSIKMNRDEFVSSLEKIDVSLSQNQADMLDKYYEMLIEKNKVMNLTAITDYEDVLIKHFFDSLTLRYALNKAGISEELDGKTLVDVGTGAGFPGMVLKVAYPKLKVTLLDSLNKRLNFLNEVIDELKLEDINTVHARAEEGARNKAHRESYDLGVSRAVANMATLTEYVLPYVKLGGLFIAYKSQTADEELESAKKAIALMGGEIVDNIKFEIKDIDGTSMERDLVIIKKVKKTPAKYPRKAGTPSKEPIVG